MLGQFCERRPGNALLLLWTEMNWRSATSAFAFVKGIVTLQL
jgi:hypothetical protein